MFKAAALLVIGSLLTLILEVIIFTSRGQVRMFKKSNKFKKEFIDELSYFESPRGLDKDIKNMLDKEMSKIRDESKNYHPAKKNPQFQVDTSRAIEPIHEKLDAQLKGRRNPEYESINIALFEQFNWPYKK